MAKSQDDLELGDPQELQCTPQLQDTMRMSKSCVANFKRQQTRDARKHAATIISYRQQPNQPTVNCRSMSITSGQYIRSITINHTLIQN